MTVAVDTDGYTRHIAKIKSTQLGWEDHGILTAYLQVDYGDSGHQGVGGYDLRAHNGARASIWIQRVLLACGVDQWEKLPGRTIYVLRSSLDGGYPDAVVGIEPLPTENGRRFIFADVAVEERDHS